ncbi:MAG: nucleoside deaminase [Oscillospiraceae bacterium]|nr:nucleoside deaminase [Oscillospiraceae bacterium]
MNDTQHTPEFYMAAALELARLSALEGEVPVGAVIVKDGEIIATGRNRRETEKNALFHAEIEAIGAACQKLGGWRLWQCQLYVTLEPCPMCAGAILNARIPQVYFGARDEKNGACGSVTDLFSLPFAYRPQVTAGILEEECSGVLREFFVRLREELKHRPKWKKPS